MDTGKSPLRLASQGSAVHGQDLCAEGSYSTTENCDPNVMIGWTSTPVKNNNPLSAKSKAVVSSEKRVVQRELYCDGRVQETSRSPEKGSPTKVTVTPTRRHFCRSPRCAANDPDYASPVQSQPRKFLRSKRHLLPGWQAPPSSKRKVEASPAGGGHHPSTSSPGLNYEVPQVLNDACMVDKVNNKDGRVSDNCDDSITKDVQLEPTDAVADIYQSDCRGEDQKEATSPSKSNSEHSVMHTPPMCGECEEKGTGVVQIVSVECTSWCEFEEGDRTLSESNCEQSVIQISADSEGCEGEVVDPLCMISMEVVNSCGDSEEGNSTPSVTICERHEKEVAGTGQLVTIDDRECTDDDCLLHTTMAVADKVVEPSQLPDLEAHQNSSTRGLFTVNDEACSDVTVSMAFANTVVDPSRLSGLEAHQNSSGRGLFTVSDEAYSDATVSLRRQAAAERKNPENWMSDTLIREAVTRLAPEGEGGVHVLVQAFESIMLMEEETHDTKPARLFGRPGVGTSKALQNFVADHGQVSPAVLRCSIGKVQAWDETMAATPDLVDAKEEEEEEEEVQEMTMAGCSDDSGSCSTAEPMEQHNKGWGPVFSALDAITRSDDDVSSDDGGSSTSSESGLTDGTFATQSQAEVRSNHQLKRYTSLQPFRLRTEERGALKEYEFAKRVEQLFREEQRLRVPVAQGLPWTTDEPDVPYKPPPKEQTKPVEFRLLSEIRAHERAEFDNYVAERRFQMELERQEEERMRQLAEQEEIRRMRREMVPRAQLMPYFDRPFIPRRSSKRLTVPKEPCFQHIHSKKAKCRTMVSTA